jgi:hypothetical protein
VGVCGSEGQGILSFLSSPPALLWPRQGNYWGRMEKRTSAGLPARRPPNGGSWARDAAEPMSIAGQVGWDLSSSLQHPPKTIMPRLHTKSRMGREPRQSPVIASGLAWKITHRILTWNGTFQQVGQLFLQVWRDASKDESQAMKPTFS